MVGSATRLPMGFAFACFIWGAPVMRLVLSTFAVLAFVFYEMSGGSDFKPPVPPTDTAQSSKTLPQPTRVDPPAPEIAQAPSTDVKTPVSKPAPDRIIAEETQPDATKQTNLAQIRSGLSQGLTLLPASNPADGLQLVSLELGASGLRPTPATLPEVAEETAVAQPAAFIEPEPDLREVTGTRVNMRDGPGTIYPVLASLTIGKQVEVLSDSGTGWLRLRTLPEQQLGWISASLISKSE